MFYGCHALITVDLSTFNTSYAKDISYMFKDCIYLKTIYACDNFVTYKVTNSSKMFTNCKELKGICGTTYNDSHTDATYARVDGGEGQPGYFTYRYTSGISGINADAPAPKAIYNLSGQKVDDSYKGIYNLSGQKVDDNYKGIVIINGKKIMKR